MHMVDHESTITKEVWVRIQRNTFTEYLTYLL